MFTKASLLSIFASIAAAQLHAAVGEPKGNPISRPLNEIVPACKPFTITWQPTTPNTVSVLLLKGPAVNVVKFGPALAEGIANSGTLVWTPASSLEATTGPNGYGIQIIDDVTGQYQYSTQFGISTDGCVASSSAPASASGSAAGYPVASPSSKEGYPVASPSAEYSASKSAVHSAYPTAPYPTKPAASTLIYSTGVPYNTTAIQPTGSLTIPSSLRPTASGNATTSRLPEATGAASALQAGLSFAGAAVAFAFML
ncbi:hypothetical protein T440DRAFT_477476 [Plenodomus tracheiphilus IPT5]|uniref:Yeast cell wall synthesis Kre9/Knh1-like N-terminal domain-containing protein n=1 Tax=Plenodomus tracheiphilus IPT5 TaxID=1408161 RepID=A0A6A7BAZ4_9PLEO|nr:hypothetical protein T440DRAFT_477476 [Plenodomus tracheiphilus IPT5]